MLAGNVGRKLPGSMKCRPHYGGDFPLPIHLSVPKFWQNIVTTESLIDPSLSTEFVTVAIDQPDCTSRLPQTIMNALQAVGDPLRWAITSVDAEQRKLYVEAVVTTSAQAH